MSHGAMSENGTTPLHQIESNCKYTIPGFGVALDLLILLPHFGPWSWRYGLLHFAGAPPFEDMECQALA